MDIAWFTLVAIALYFGADRLLDWIERARGARFANRQVAFFAIMLPLALAAFWLMRVLTGPGP
jgi:predicted PurR-regulated permease PerM